MNKSLMKPRLSPVSALPLIRLPNTATKLAVFGDVHIGVHDDAATKLMVECFEREGCDFAVANGDNHDCGAISRHPGKAALSRLESGQLAEEIATGRWLIDWLATRPSIYGVGNHEDWINAVALHSGAVGSITVRSVLNIPSSIVVAEHGYQIRAGNLAIEHGDILFARSGGPANLAAAVLRKCPDQTTIVNHFHRQDYATHTTVDNAGIPRSHAAFTLGHLSRWDAHTGYAGRVPNWQQGAAIVDIWAEGAKRRFTVHMIEVHRDRYNRPIFEFNGHVYR